MCGIVGGITCAAWWAFTLHPPAVSVISLPTVTPPPPAVTAIDPALWSVCLYQPLSDAPKVTAPTSSTLNLVSIITKDGVLIAAIAVQESVEGLTASTLAFVKKGEVLPWGTIQELDAQSVEVLTGGNTVRLELAR